MFARVSKLKAYQVLCTILFGLIFIGLPLTTFPPIRRITGSTVAPFSALPLFALIVIWLVPYLIGCLRNYKQNGSACGIFLIKEFVPIFYFVIFTIIISAAAYFLDGFFLLGRTFFSQTVRALFTLAIGLSFYVTLTAYMQTEAIIHMALKFIYAGGVWLILWSIFEIILLRIYGLHLEIPEPIYNFKMFFVYQDMGIFFIDRLTGFAFEPSWYVLIFNLVLFPIWLSAIYQRKSIFNLKVGFFIIEDLLFSAGVAAFTFSFPRIGLLALVLMLLLFGAKLFKRVFRFMLGWVMNHQKLHIKNTYIVRIVLSLVLITIIGTAIFGAATVFLGFMSERDNRFQLLVDQILTLNLRNLPTSETDIILFARQLAFMERTIYWFAGWNVFADYPFGVGLGNVGFYLTDRIHSLGYDSHEVRNLFFRAPYPGNTKSLWIRLLAETGFIGFSIFITWVLILWRNSAFIQKSKQPIMKLVGLTGHFFVLAFIVEGFSVDSFAFPYLWVIPSLISASSLLVRKEITANLIK